ncbi:MAG TPA: ATP-binding cassette domain-containing protein [Tepidisphaeraceae bacterium]
MTNPSAEPAIDLRQVFKTYGRRVQALQGVDLRVHRGEVFGLLGPNGAGKSTLVKIIMTVVRPTRVEGTVLGHPVGHKPTLAHVGYLPENHRFPKYLTGRQVLDFFAALAKVDRATRRRRTAELLDMVGMTQWADTKIATYSKGMLQRVGLAQALVHEPELVMLDEPTDGVDPVGRRDILDILGRLRGQGRTVFVNSHALSELESISDRVAILVKGRVAKQGTLDELTVARQRYEIDVATEDPLNGRQRVRAAVPAVWKESVEVPAAPFPPVLPSGAPPPLHYAGFNMGPAMPPRMIPVDRGTLRDGPRVELAGLTLRIETTDPAAVQGVIDALRGAGLIIRRVQSVRPSLEDLFLDTVIDPGTGRAFTPGATLSKAPAMQGARP